MDAAWNFPDGNITDLLESRRTDSFTDINYRLHTHSSLIRRLALEKELEGHQGCVNALTWNSRGSLLISGSDDTQINIWSYANRSLVHSVDTGHSSNIFCTRFIPETSDECVVSGAGDAEVRVFHLSHSRTRSAENFKEPLAHFQCHSRRVKKLAVENGNPNIIWSASEDGTLRQHDLREGASCPPVGSPNQECRNVLLDLRSGAKKSLSDCPKQCLLLKSCDVSPTRPHELLVGGSDAFGRLYDRRMLPPLSSCRTKTKPPPCVNYFCPIHLSERRSSSLHLTHVAFSPNGEEVLLSYSGEHVYLMNVNHGGQISMTYCANDIPKRTYLPPVLSQLEAFKHQPISSNNIPRKASSKLDMYKKLLQSAVQSLEEGSNYLYGIEACSEILDGKGAEIGDLLMHECLCTRAALFLKRKWKNDAHMAIRDCQRARGIDALSFRPYHYLAEALIQLGKYQEALDYALAAQSLAPSNPEVVDKVRMIKEQLLAAEAERRRKENEAMSRSEMQPRKRRTLGEVLFQSEGSDDDASEGGHLSEREDSDYEEMELDFVTSLAGDESRDLESRIFRGSLNLRFHRGDESSRDNFSLNHPSESPSTSSQNENAVYQHEIAIDMKQRYVGHCNVGTDIKQASFLGHQGEYIASGSDDGRWFIWEKRTGRLIKMLLGDEAVVNCVQCHPFDCTVATSGIDSTIKIWMPHAQMPSIVGGTAGPEASEVSSILARNQQKLFRNREMLSFEFLERFRMHDFAEGNLPPFECAQS